MSKEKIKDIWRKYKYEIIAGGTVVVGIISIIISNKSFNKNLENLENLDNIIEDLSIEDECFDKFFVIMDSDLNKGSYEHLPITSKSFNYIKTDTFKQMKEHGIDPNAFESMDVFIGLNPKMN